MKVGIYFLEYDNARAGTLRAAALGAARANSWCSAWSRPRWRRWRAADYLKRRIEDASRYIKLEQLGLSPQCGFSTSAAEHVAVTEEIERRSSPASSRWRGGYGGK